MRNWIPPILLTALWAVVLAILFTPESPHGHGFPHPQFAEMDRGGAGLVYKMGASSFWMVVATSIGISISFFLLGKRLRLFAELREPISLRDAVAARYGSRTTSLLTAVAILLGVMGYLATQILAMATVLQNILASVYTDLVQGLIMVVAALLVLVTAIVSSLLMNFTLKLFDAAIADIWVGE